MVDALGGLRPCLYDDPHLAFHPQLPHGGPPLKFGLGSIL